MSRRASNTPVSGETVSGEAVIQSITRIAPSYRRDRGAVPSFPSPRKGEGAEQL
jgi:hypothetical protein